MIITVAMLKKKRACVDQVERFERTFPLGCAVTLDNLRVAGTAQLDLGWAAQNLLPAGPSKAYGEATAGPSKAYGEAMVGARKAYDEAMVGPRKAYDEATARASKAYDEATLIALYDAARDAGLTED